MQGFFVTTSPAENPDDESILNVLKQRGFVDLKTTRSFNAVTKGVYKKSVKSAKVSLKNKTAEAKEKRRAYESLPEVKERSKRYHKEPEVKKRRRQAYQRKKLLLSLVPEDIIHKALLKEQEMAEQEGKGEDEMKEDDSNE